MRCPIHLKEDLVPSNTKYGKRYACPVENCTVVQWDGSTSTPADYETRQMRIKAHEHFDKLWRCGPLKRHQAYKRLAKFMDISTKHTHIGHFNVAQCKLVIEFCKTIMEDK